jgi:hypothetical protein
MISGKRGLVGTTAMVALMSSGAVAPALAQATIGAPGRPATQQERPDLRSPAARAAENYDPVGVPVGSFRLFPELELGEAYNDNIYAVPSAQGKTSSFIQYIKPKLDLRSDWSQHMLNFFARGNFGIYSVDSLNNFWDFGVGTDGRLDIQRDWNIYAGGSFNRLHEDRGSPNTVTTANVPPNMYNQIAANLGYFQKFNRLSVRLDGRMDNYNYINQGPGPTAGIIFNSDRNRTEFREAARIGYEFSPGFEFWVRGSMNQRTYMTNPDSLGYYHNSNGWDVVGGLTIDFGGITSIEAFGGYVEQVYVDYRFPKVSAAAFGLAAYWNPIRELWVKPFVRRTVEESALTSTSAYLNTAMGLDVEYRMRPNIRLDGHFDYSIADYNAVSGSGANRLDQYITFRAGIQYLPTPNFFIGPSYQFIHRSSSVANSDYDQNLIMLRLGTRI